jgi:NAD(P)H-hydrate epimerase
MTIVPELPQSVARFARYRELATNSLDKNSLPGAEIPVLSAEQMQTVIRYMVEDYGLGNLQTLENAGRALAILGRKLLGGNLKSKKLIVLAGAGYCGAAGMVSARYLFNWGAEITVVMTRTIENLGNMAYNQHRLLRRLNIPVFPQTSLAPLRLLNDMRHSDMIFDAIIGWGLHAKLYGNEAFLVQVLRQTEANIVSLDYPSGLPPDKIELNEEEFSNLCVKANATLAVALPKSGLIAEYATPFVGNLYLADIGVPPSLYKRLGLEVDSLFSLGEILQLTQKK